MAVRDLALKTLLVLTLALLAGFAWLTRHPQSRWVDRAAEWPVVGALAREFAARYRPPPPATEAAPSTPPVSRRAAAPAGGTGPADREPVGAVPRIWVEDGTVLRAEPRDDAAAVLTLPAIANLALFERAGDWYRVAYRGRRGWAHLPDRAEPGRPPLGSAPRPPGPVPALPPDAERLTAARALLGPGGRESRLGAYRLLTDAPAARLGGSLERAVTQLESFYAERYGLRPLGEPREAVVLFADEDDFRSFQAGEPRLTGIASAGLASGGVVATFVGQRRAGAVASTVAHEIGHLLNRRALGPALPAWLDEGLAGDLAYCVQESDGALEPARLGGVAESDGGRWEWRGGLAAAIQLRRAVEEERLPPLADLLALDWEDFVAAAESPLHYAQSAFWVRHLLAHPELGPRFRAFLGAVAGGSPASAGALAERLGKSWPELDSGFRIWVRLRFHEPREVLLEGL